MQLLSLLVQISHAEELDPGVGAERQSTPKVDDAWRENPLLGKIGTSKQRVVMQYN
jgi:hypothetical protein